MIENLFNLFVGTNIYEKTRILNGQQTSITRRPFQVQVTEGNCYDECGFCGGAIIAPNWVLTAKHCVKEAITSFSFLKNVEIKVKAGNHVRHHGEVREVPKSSIIVHDSAGIYLNYIGIENWNSTKCIKF